MTLRCADCGKRAPNTPLAGQLPDPDGIRDNWQELWTREVGLPHYTYTPSTTCNGCTGTLVDDDGTVVVQGLSKEALETGALPNQRGGGGRGHYLNLRSRMVQCLAKSN